MAENTKSDPLAIPDFLLVKNRKPLTEAQHAALVAKRASDPPPLTFSLDRPRNLDPEGEAMLAALNAPKKPRAPSVTTRLPSTPRPSKDGLTSVAELARELDMLPRVARGILRAHAFPKPDVGWAFNAAQCDAVRVLLKAGPVVSDKPPVERKQRVTKRRKRSRVPAGAGKTGAAVFTGKASVTRPPAPQLAVHANIIEAKNASRIKEQPGLSPRAEGKIRRAVMRHHKATAKEQSTCSPPKRSSTKSPRTSSPSKLKGSASSSSKRQSSSRSKSSKRSTSIPSRKRS